MKREEMDEIIAALLLSNNGAALVARVAREIANSLVNNNHYRMILRDVVLRTVVEQHELRSMDAVRAFLHACEKRGIKITVGPDGSLRSNAWSELGPELKAVLILYRSEIAKRLEAERDVEEKTRQRLERTTTNRNGATK